MQVVSGPGHTGRRIFLRNPGFLKSNALPEISRSDPEIRAVVWPGPETTCKERSETQEPDLDLNTPCNETLHTDRLPELVQNCISRAQTRQ